MKKRLLTLSILVTCLATIASGTLAFFTAGDTAHNIITSGGVDIELIEKAVNPDEDPAVPDDEFIDFEDVDGVMPGDIISKIVTVHNNGTAAAWVRIKVDVSIGLAEGITGVPDVSLVQINYDDDPTEGNWTERDGYWYYNQALQTGETTTPLFTEVNIHELMDNMYQSCSINVDVIAQAVQVDNNGTTALDAAGWATDDSVETDESNPEADAE